MFLFFFFLFFLLYHVLIFISLFFFPLFDRLDLKSLPLCLSALLSRRIIFIEEGTCLLGLGFLLDGDGAIKERGLGVCCFCC